MTRRPNFSRRVKFTAAAVGAFMFGSAIVWIAMDSVRQETGLIMEISESRFLGFGHRYAMVRTERFNLAVPIAASSACRVGDRVEVEIAIGPRGEREGRLAGVPEPCRPATPSDGTA